MKEGSKNNMFLNVLVLNKCDSSKGLSFSSYHQAIFIQYQLKWAREFAQLILYSFTLRVKTIYTPHQIFMEEKDPQYKSYTF